MSSFALLTDMDGKIVHCYYDDTDLRLNTRVGDAFDDAFGSAVKMDLKVFLDMVCEKGIPDHVTINAPVVKSEKFLISGVRWGEKLLVTGLSYEEQAALEIVDSIKQTNLQQLIMTRTLLETHDFKDTSMEDDVVIREMEAHEKALESERKNQQLNAELTRQLRQMAMLSRMNSALQMCNTMEELYRVVGVFIEKLFDSPGGSLFMYRPELNKFEVRVRWGQREDRAALGLSEESFIEVLNQQNSQQKITGFLQEKTSNECLLLRIPEDSSMIGVLYVQLKKKISTSDPFFSQYQQTLLRLIGLAITNMQYRQWLKQDAMIDHLTNLYNQRFINLQLDRELSRALRTGSFLSVVMLDLDNFTANNDRYGHLWGDQYLIEFGNVLTRCVRKEDYACRYEDDEFTLILVDSTQEDAIMIIDRIKAECKAVRVSEQTLPMPFTSGVATFPTDGRNPEDVLKRAKEVLYMMKHRRKR
jgi:diguanylate cyclase (GGDEF)-like protein